MADGQRFYWLYAVNVLLLSLLFGHATAFAIGNLGSSPTSELEVGIPLSPARHLVEPRYLWSTSASDEFNKRALAVAPRFAQEGGVARWPDPVANTSEVERQELRARVNEPPEDWRTLGPAFKMANCIFCTDKGRGAVDMDSAESILDFLKPATFRRYIKGDEAALRNTCVFYTKSVSHGDGLSYDATEWACFSGRRIRYTIWVRADPNPARVFLFFLFFFFFFLSLSCSLSPSLPFFPFLLLPVLVLGPCPSSYPILSTRMFCQRALSTPSY